jgi:RNA polymerase sigma-70 factor, ECF subfamily
VDGSRSPETEASAAFTTHVLPELELLYRVAWSFTHHHADAEDLVQDTLLRAFRAIDRFDGRHPRAWLITIMRNAQINRVRRRRPDLLDEPGQHGEGPGALAEPARGPEDQLVDRQLDAAVELAYRDLPDEFREVIDLVDLAGTSYAEAALALDIPKGTVMSRLHRGRKRLRAALADPDDTIGARP